MLLFAKVGVGQSISFNSPFTFSYDGQPHRPNDEIVCSAFSGYIVTRSYTDQFGNSVTAPINVGSYIVTVSLTGGCVLSRSQNFTITSVPLTITAINANKVYGTTQGTLTGSSEFSPTGLQNEETIGSVTLNFGVGATSESDPVGSTSEIMPSAPIGGTFTASNYTISYVSRTLTVIPKPLTITATAGQTKVYGASDPTSYAYTLSAPLVGSDVLTGALTRAAGEIVGPYAISQGTLNNANYDITYVSSNFTITKKPLTITATAGQTKVYGANDPTSYAYTLSAPLVGSDVLTGALTRVAGESVGLYAISQGALTNANYDIAYVGSDFSITKAPLTITAKPHTILYNGTAYSGGNGVVPIGFAAGESISSLTGTLNYTGTSQGAKNVDTYTIIPDGLSSPNYTISYIDGILKIEKKEINVIADSQSKEYNTTDPPLTYTFSPSPLIGSDNFTGALIRSIGEVPGPYEINQGTLSLSSNYQLNFTKGILTIKPETIFFFEIPNAFVPGSSNDLDNKFRVFYNSAFRPELFKSLSIYNRNGQFIKRFDSITDSWDGRIDFVLQEADVYLWTVAFNPTINDNEKINISKIPKSGTFILLK